MGKNPAFQFYTGDWMKDPALRSVSAAARGLWTDLLCLMFESPTKFKFEFSGFKESSFRPHSESKRCPKVDSQQQVDEPLLISRMTGVSSKQIKKLLIELESAGVFSRDEHGRIYSRRLERDERDRQLKREAGKLGGNPILLKQKDNQEVNQTSNQNPTPSSSFSSSTSNKYVNEILSFWNSSGLPVSKDRNTISKALHGGRTAEEITAGIKNYKLILDGDYLLKTLWSLRAFLTNHLEKFLSLEQAKEFYRRRGGRVQTDVSPGEAYEKLARKNPQIP